MVYSLKNKTDIILHYLIRASVILEMIIEQLIDLKGDINKRNHYRSSIIIKALHMVVLFSEIIEVLKKVTVKNLNC